METKLLKTAVAMPLAAAGLALAANSADAAILGPGTFDIGGTVTVTGAVGADGAGGTADDLFTFDFGGTTRVDVATGGFSGYEGTTASIQNLVLPPASVAPGGSSFPIEDFLTFNDGDTFTLTAINPPQFQTVTTPGGRVTTFVQYAFDGSVQGQLGLELPAEGIFTSQFTGSSESRLAALVSGQPLRTTYSASFEAVPEPFTIAGSAMAVGFGAMFRKKIKDKQKAKKS
jgi:hypothetical protein